MQAETHEEQHLHETGDGRERGQRGDGRHPAEPHPTHENDEHGHGDHAHEGGGPGGFLAGLFQLHSHSHYPAALDPSLANARGIRALKVSLAALLATAVFQLGVVWISGSAALLADTLHNFSDALTAVPLWLAFSLAKRAANRRYTYGYGRAEDLAGVLIVLMILGSAILVLYESFQKMVQNQAMTNVGWVAAAAIIGFIGNEFVAMYRIRVGREIGSAALVADGLHARTDGITSLGVLVGALGVWLGFPLADPLMGFVIGAAILYIAWGAAREMWLRMMDAVDPDEVAQIEAIAAGVEGVQAVHGAALRWLGHRQRGELHIVVDGSLPTFESHAIVENVRHALFHGVPALAEITVHVDPVGGDPGDDVHPTQHHMV